ncbi:LacI family transcriptional regulator [Novosphingobium sp. KCTC 2891]|uniref:LacI family DNA-binding transcriptional regulator n=1 Tax=Novosphingobium sp. KCTC 2891 TaxID=2989730 RepID=UPI002221CA0D|nr:LacI family DNA-binding transcriptional regulator [Novosphingobium sp. KCTC 2891]MCW1381924.1 LacI family transcriptional regulator [Novosphingobium sp. KCTC 2891]
MADLARIAGVSVSTVSRALTGKGTLNEKTRERVRALADAHGFRLNVAAQNLRLGRTGAIGVLLPLGHERCQHLSDPFFSAMLGHLADELAERGYDLLLSRVLPKRKDWLDDFVRSGRTDGIIVIGQSDQGATLNRTARSYRNMVVWGAHDPANAYITVGSDNVAGGQIAARHLVARGRRRLAYFGNIAAPEFAAREAGFLETLPDDIRRDVDIVPVHLTPEGSYEAAMAYFGAGNRPDGIFAASDIIAMSVIGAAAEHGIAVPRDMSLIGFDDVLVARIATPPLTTVHQDIAGGARLLVDLLCRRLAGEHVASVTLTPRLVERESS